MSAGADEVTTPAQTFASRTFACSYSGGYYSVPEADWDAVFAELERRAAALRDIRKAMRPSPTWRAVVQRICAILDVAGY
jgi:hypothetical protein